MIVTISISMMCVPTMMLHEIYEFPGSRGSRGFFDTLPCSVSTILVILQGFSLASAFRRRKKCKNALSDTNVFILVDYPSLLFPSFQTKHFLPRHHTRWISQTIHALFTSSTYGCWLWP